MKTVKKVLKRYKKKGIRGGYEKKGIKKGTKKGIKKRHKKMCGSWYIEMAGKKKGVAACDVAALTKKALTLYKESVVAVLAPLAMSRI